VIGFPITEICPRAGVIEASKYDLIQMDQSLAGEGIDAGDFAYSLATTDVESGDLAPIKTPDGLLVRFIYWVVDASGKLKVRLESAHPEIAPRFYDYDDQVIRTRWRVVWICKQGDHGRCFPFKRRASRLHPQQTN